MRRLLRPVLIFLAIVFLIEAWLWDKLEPIFARIIGVIPWGRMKTICARWIDALPPAGTLIVFVVPFAISIPIKLLEFWFFANGAWVEGLGALLLSKFVVLGMTAFVFDVTRDKLMQIEWFRVLYHYVLWLRAVAHDLVEPIKRRIRMRMRMLAPRRASRGWRLLRRIRRRAHAEAADQPPTADVPRGARTVRSP
jgi:hypothetical protein